MQSSGQLHATAIVRGEARIALPAGAQIEADHVAIPSSPVVVHKLAPGDVIETDSQGRITAVRSASTPPIFIRFKPGTATSPEDSDVVRGAPAESAPTIALAPADGIEMTGAFHVGERVPGGGTVEASGSAVATITGAVVLGMSYIPSAYVGLGSPRSSDQVLLAPLIGPWIDLANRGSCNQPQLPAGVSIPVDPCAEESAVRAALVTGGIIQAAGAILLIAGLPFSAQVVGGPDNPSKRPPGNPAPIAPRAALVPAGSGIALVGTF
jgi:hypothetical protein